MKSLRNMIAAAALVAAACGGPGRDCPRRDGEPAFAVVMSDYLSTSIGLLDASAEPLTECWIDSGTRAPGLVAALSGDVVLATDQSAGALAVIDRFRTDTFSRVSLDEPVVLGQVRLQDPAVSGAFSSNPHDAVTLSGSSAWVSRFGANADADAPPVARGSDLLEIDPTAFERTGRRISFESLIETVSVTTDAGPVTKRAYPRPSRIVQVGARLVVGLARLTLPFDGAAQGAVALVDPDSGAVRLHPLADGVANCGRVVPVPDASDRVVVGCAGFSRPFGEEAQVRPTAGVFVLRVSGSSVRTVRSWLPREDAGAPLAVAEVVAIDEDTVAALDYGDPGPDRYFVVDLETGRAELLFEARRSFQIGAGTYDPSTTTLLVPDESEGVRRFTRSGDGRFTERAPLPLDGGGVGLPPRSVYSLQ